MLLEKSALRLAQQRTARNLSICNRERKKKKKYLSAKFNKAKCNKKSYACNGMETILKTETKHVCLPGLQKVNVQPLIQ